MLAMEERALKLRGKKPELDDLKSALGIDRLKVQIEELEQKAAQPGFWDNAEESQKILKQTGSLKGTVEGYEKLCAQYDDLEVMIELANDDNDESAIPEIDKEMDELEKGIETARLETLLTGEYDEKDAILTFHAGAGGTEAQDWASMLYRMYTRWAERHGFKVQDPRLSGRRRGRHQKRFHPDRRVRTPTAILKCGGGRAPAGARLPLRRLRPPSDLLRLPGSHA